MIPFNLLRAKQGVPMHTRKGFEAKFIAHLNGGQPAPVVVEIMKREVDKRGFVIPETTMMENYYITGRHGLVHDSEYDLFMKY
jgi:hypothetical protein